MDNGGLYCGPCVHVDPRKRECKEWHRKLAYSKISGPVSTLVFEKCRECRDLERMWAEDEAKGDET